MNMMLHVLLMREARWGAEKNTEQHETKGAVKTETGHFKQITC